MQEGPPVEEQPKSHAADPEQKNEKEKPSSLEDDDNAPLDDVPDDDQPETENVEEATEDSYDDEGLSDDWVVKPSNTWNLWRLNGPGHHLRGGCTASTVCTKHVFVAPIKSSFVISLPCLCRSKSSSGSAISLVITCSSK